MASNEAICLASREIAINILKSLIDGLKKRISWLRWYHAETEGKSGHEYLNYLALDDYVSKWMVSISPHAQRTTCRLLLTYVK